MIKFRSLISLLILFIAVNVLLVSFNSDCKDVLWGTKTLYKPLQYEYTSQPLGYDPVFINYVGRHGARHQTSITTDSILYLVLRAAEIDKALTKSGEQLKRMDSLLLIIEKGNVSLITEKGYEEQVAIGKRMARNFPSIFAAGKGFIKISTTKKERTKQSSRAFINGVNPDTAFAFINNFSDNDELAFYDVSPAYKAFKEGDNNKASFEIIQDSEKAKQLYEEIPKLFFTTVFIKKLNSASLHFHSEKKEIVVDCKSFSDAFYDACSIAPSIDKEIEKLGFSREELDFKSLVTCSEVNEFSYINSAEDFLLKGPGTDNEGIQVRIAAPLLMSFLKSAEEYITSKNVIADLRFGHAETLAPFAAILGITGASESLPGDKIQEYNKIWHCENIIPLSSNIQWILFMNKNSGDYLVKFMLNEKEVTINGLKDSGNPYYYKWEEVRNFYYRKLDKMNVNRDDNMHDYLINIK